MHDLRSASRNNLIHSRPNSALPTVPEDEDLITALPTVPAQPGPVPPTPTTPSFVPPMRTFSLKSKGNKLQKKRKEAEPFDNDIRVTTDIETEIRNVKSLADIAAARKQQQLQLQRQLERQQQSKWSRFVKAIKRPFHQKKAPASRIPFLRRGAKHNPIRIGEPSDFQHLCTGADCLASPATTDTSPIATSYCVASVGVAGSAFTEVNVDDDADEWETIRSMPTYPNFGM